MNVAVLCLQNGRIEECKRLHGFAARRILFRIADDHVLRHRYGQKRRELIVIYAVMRQLQNIAGQISSAVNQLFQFLAFRIAHKQIGAAVIEKLCDQRLLVVALSVERNGGDPHADHHLAEGDRFVGIKP